MNKTDRKLKVLHVANWYPNPWDNIEGSFVRDQIRIFKKVIEAETVVVQVRNSSNVLPKYRSLILEDNARGYFLLAGGRPGRVKELLSTLLLMFVLIREKAWRYDALHFHIAYPLLLNSKLWRRFFSRPFIISEHWSAYHYNFYLPENHRSLRLLREPFKYGDVVLAVSESLLNDIKDFSKFEKFPSYVIPNYVPFHKVGLSSNKIPTLFIVNRWSNIKNPIPMLQGLERAASLGAKFKLVIGGYGDLLDEMMLFVKCGPLSDCTRFLGKMNKSQIADQLNVSDGYLFASNYETFSIACAEALCSGVPLIGPYIPAIDEYADKDCWVKVEKRDSEGWHIAITSFLSMHSEKRFDRLAIANRATRILSEEVIREKYREVVSKYINPSF